MVENKKKIPEYNTQFPNYLINFESESYRANPFICE